VWIAVSIVGGIIGLFLAMTLVGLVLPQRHVCSLRATLKQSPASVWEALTDIEQFPRWRPEVSRIELLPAVEGHILYREHSRHGAITFERMEAEPCKRLVGRIADRTLPFGGGWTYELLQANGGTQVTITETGAVYNPLFRFMSRFIFGHRKTIDTYLRQLGKKFGEKVVPEVTTAAHPAAWEIVLGNQT
jgi:uncharacterized protein YndB with AHSA1/START domain